MRAALRRMVLFGAIGIFGLSGSVVLASSAGAVTPVSVAGTAPATAVGPSTITISYTISVTSPITSASLDTHQDAALPASLTGVILDGTPVPSAQVARVGTGDLTVAVGPNPTDGLTVGTHLITIQATVPAGAAVRTLSSASLAYDDGAAQTVASAAVVVAVNQPDLAVALTPDTDEDPGEVGPLGTGSTEVLAVDVTNVGYGTPQTVLTVMLPPGVVLDGDSLGRDDDDNAELPCIAVPANPRQLSCAIGTVAHTAAADDPTLLIPLTTTQNPPVGAVAPITVAVAPADASQGVDSNASNNQESFPIRLTGKAALSYTVTPATKKIQLGETTTVRLTVHNSGPNLAGEAIAVSVIVGSEFQIVGFTGNATAPAAVSSTFAAADSSDGGSAQLWYIGDLPAGHTASAVLTIKATAQGAAKVGLFAISDATNPACPDLSCIPPTVTVTAIPVVKVLTPAPKTIAPQPAVQATAELANTGGNWASTFGSGVTALLAGLALMVFGRRRTG